MKHGKNQNEGPDYGFLEDEATAKKKERRKYLLITFLNTVLIYGLYVVLMQFPYFEAVLIVYLVALAAFAFGYVFYNRGFTRKNLTPDMLPETWSQEEKELYISDGKKRLQKSKWCLTVIFPLVLTFFLDMFYLFIYEPYFSAVFENLF